MKTKLLSGSCCSRNGLPKINTYERFELGKHHFMTWKCNSYYRKTGRETACCLKSPHFHVQLDGQPSRCRVSRDRSPSSICMLLCFLAFSCSVSMVSSSNSTTPLVTISIAGNSSTDKAKTTTSLAQLVCRVGVVAPVNLDLYGLSDNTSFWQTLEHARKEASEILRSVCSFEMHVHFTTCHFRTAVSASLNVSNDSEALIGPPCSSVTRVAGLLGKPVLSWVPLVDSKGEEDGSSDENADVDDHVTSSFGTYKSLAVALHLVLDHFGWTNVAMVFSQEPQCSHLSEAIVNTKSSNNMLVRLFTFNSSNETSAKETLTQAREDHRVFISCVASGGLTAFLTSVESVGMTTGSYAFIHVLWGTWSDVGGTKAQELLHRFDNVLYVVLLTPHLVDLISTAQPAHSNPALQTSSLHDQAGFLEYFHDAILLWAVARSRSSGEALNFTNLTIADSLTRTGELRLDERGQRVRRHALLQVQERRVRRVADLTEDFEIRDDLKWPGGQLPAASTDPPDIKRSDSDMTTSSRIVVSVVAGVLMLLAALFFFRWWKHQKKENSWKIDDSIFKRQHTQQATPQSQTKGHLRRLLLRMETVGTQLPGSITTIDHYMLFTPVGHYKGMVVAVKTIKDKSFKLTKELIADFSKLKELNHDNINTFVGANIEPGNNYILFNYCTKGSLRDVLDNKDIPLDWMFKISFIMDLVSGMRYLHKSPLKSHGNLKSTNCVIDSRWMLKVTDFGALTSSTDDENDDASEPDKSRGLLWTAPELLRIKLRPKKGTQKGDVFSFAIIVQEIFLRVDPYEYNKLSTDKIIARVERGDDPPFRPVIPEDSGVPDKGLTLMTSFWEEVPDSRPHFHIIKKRVVELNGGTRLNVVDNMLSLMEVYSTRLEQLVAERTAELAQEKARTDRLLYQMLPPSVAEQLKMGKPVVPEFYESVSIFFSDIVGFTTIASDSKPLEIVEFLNDLYTAFDDVIFKHDVYKVETIGDAYMCVSGCPRRNGRRHSAEIVEMALDLVSTVTSFRIRHRPKETLNVRVGLHTGPCAAGVVGVVMPRYCLFGDTVNMASRMESTGKALHIHISADMNLSLESLDMGFLTLERGVIEIKGKGFQQTFWLVGRKGYTNPLPKTFSRLRKILEEYGVSRSLRPSSIINKLGLPIESHYGTTTSNCSLVEDNES